MKEEEKRVHLYGFIQTAKNLSKEKFVNANFAKILKGFTHAKKSFLFI